MALPGAKEQIINFDIDRYVNPWIPHNRIPRLPKVISRWLGYRPEPVQEPCAILQWPFMILATIAGLCLCGGISSYAPGWEEWHPPVLIASLGASAVLEFNTIRSPLSQPRNSILGNTLAALCGVCIAKLFQLNSNFDNIQWVSGAVGCALASWVMSLTGTIHPPGGATAVLASVQVQVIKMGWKYILLVLMDSTLMVCVALIFNNVLRQYPVYWWTPNSVGRKLRQERREAKKGKELDEDSAEQGPEPKRATSDTTSERTLRKEIENSIDHVEGIESMYIGPYKVELPQHIELSDEELLVVAKIQERLKAQTGN